jgi:hypothetical protein
LMLIVGFAVDINLGMTLHGPGMKGALVYAAHETIGPWSIAILASAIFNTVVNYPRFSRTRKEPLLWIAGDPRRAALRDYERKAYLSFVGAIKREPSLERRRLQDVHDWIREHGVEVDGRDYDLPDQGTWLRYRSAGEKLARSVQKRPN